MAVNQTGKPYQWGARGPDKFDCSGLITYSYKKALNKKNIFNIKGYITDDATMDDLYNWNVKHIPPEKAQPGDIIFITSSEERITHGGLFIKWIDDKTMKMVHASSYFNKVVIDSWSKNVKKGNQKFVGLGRFTKSE
ncbi:MAG: C40 family peptidase [Bacillota bacterium]